MNKKAALDLGINTIVVLVIALVIIAGGIMFISGVFNKLEPVGVIKMPEFPATASNALVVIGSAPELKMGSKENFDVSVYNKLGVDKEIDIVFDKCNSVAENPGCESVKPVLVSLSQTIVAGEATAFRTLLTANCVSDVSKKLAPGEYVCLLKAVTVEEQPEVVAESQVIVTVTN